MNQILVELQETMGSDKAIAEAAWTSSLTLQGKEKRSDTDIERVVNMLADSKHSTPFESVILRFWIKMPIATDRQFMTHRLQSASGMSGRYRTMPNEFLYVPQDIEKLLYNCHGQYWIESYDEICKQSNSTYRDMIDFFKESEKSGQIDNNGYKRLREFFRGQLPQHNMTERVSIMNLRAFANFIKLRDSEHAQPEIREVAQLMLKAVKDVNIAPIALEALKRNNWNI